ncbi:MAG TPA: SRPBCC family protein [Thermoanaerobaculia bacterium]|jgi:carbon monoxide dehydrogenase subunit G|nr:SRPBCC family protein [Thermoanaerobaculia bacterium]
MASIRKEILIDAPADRVWTALRDVGGAHRVFPGVVADTRLEEGARVITFGNGMVVRELIVDLDDDTRRFAWAATGGRLTHHNASLQAFAEGAGRTRVVWIADLLPDAMAGDVAALMEQGAGAMKRTLEGH